MKKTFLALVISFLVFINQVPAQQDLPEMHGIKIGMSARQVKRHLPFLTISKADQYEFKDAFLYVTTDPKQKIRLPKVFKLELLFLNDKLVRLWVGYYDSKKEKAGSYEKFVKLVTKSFELNENLKTSYRTYQKNGIEYQIGSENKKEVILFDLSAKEIRDRQVLE